MNPSTTNAQRVLISASPYADTELQKDWTQRGRWPCHLDCPARTSRTALRRRVSLPVTLPTAHTIRVHVTADERYTLFLDGQRIGRGSERGDADNWFFETYELTLEPGPHTLVAQVWSLGSLAPFAQMTVRHGLLIAPQAREHDALLGTGIAVWETKPLTGYTFTDPLVAWGTGANLVIDGNHFAWGFEAGEGEGWQAAATGKPGADAVWRNEIENEPLLRPALLPAMYDALFRGAVVRHVESVTQDETHDLPVLSANHLADEAAAWQALLDSDTPLTFPAHTRRRILLDLNNYVCAYPEVETDGGAKSSVRVHWQEALYSDPRRSEKGHRDEIEGKTFGTVWSLQDGVGDTFLPDGGASRRFTTLWWQCGRYVELLVVTQDAPLTLSRLSLHETRYPLERAGTFDSDDARLAELAALAFRTLQMCAHETYMDCPYFEQLMYVGDTRLQALVTYAACSDDRLPRKAVELLGASRMLSGLTQSRYPTRVRQIIPPFSLWWAGMVYDYALWRGEADFVREWMPAVRSMLDFFLPLRNADRLVVSPHGWNVQDWVPAWKDGVPPDGYDGVNGLLNWQMAYALERTARLEQWLGEPENAARSRRLAHEIAAAMQHKMWDEARGLFFDDAAGTHFSEHTQCIALLSGLLPPEIAARNRAALLAAPDLARTTIYFSHYLFETLYEAGRTDLLLQKLDLWHELKHRGLKTTVEMPEPTRSDCHAWGAHPLYHFFASLLGIRPGDMGFTTVHIAPQPGTLARLQGRMPHPQGFIEVSLRREKSRLHADITLPGDLRGVFEYAGQSLPLNPGSQSLALPDL